MLAKYRLMETGVDVSPKDPRNPLFRFAVTDVTEFGDVKMQWRTLPWSCAENAVVRCLEAFSRPLFTPESILATHLKRLEIIHGPEDAAKEAQDLANELKFQQPIKDDPEWTYFLCGGNDATVPMEERDWQPLRRMPNDFKIMKRNSREVGKWPIIVRVSQIFLVA